MRIAFHAPLKPPDHPVPSGDRRIAGLFLAALERAGHRPFLATRFRSYDGSGRRQALMGAVAGRLAARLVRTLPEFDAWFTYHLYYKAPDWIGPAVAAERGVPYYLAEASHAPKRAGGPWDTGHRAVAEAVRRAERIYCLNPNDRACLLRLVDAERLVTLPPFLDASRFAPASAERMDGTPTLLTVAMMRPGDKLASYRLLGRALARVADLDWRLLVAGDGPARDAALAALPEARTTHLGAVDEADMPDVYRQADLFAWPAEREALGMAMLEASASGLAVVSAATDGVPAVVAHGETGLLTPPGDGRAFAAALRSLLTDPDRRRAMGRAGRARVLARHDIAHAARLLP